MSEGNTAPLTRRDVGSGVWSIAVSRDGTHFASGSSDNNIHLWDLRTGSLVLGPLRGHTETVQSVAFSLDNTRIVSGSYDFTIRIWDARTGGPVAKPLKGHTDWVCSVAFSPDNTLIASGSNDFTIRIWDARTGNPMGEPLMGHTDSVYSVAFSHDNTCIASGSGDTTIRIWDVRTGNPIGEPIKGHTWAVYSVAFSHDNARIVSGSWDHTIRIWDARSRTQIGEPLRGHTGPVWSVAFSQNSTRIVSGSDDHTIRLWDARTGTPIGEPLKGHTGQVWSVAFSIDSTRIISGSGDGTIGVWKAPQSTPLIDLGAPGDTPSFDMVTSKMSAQEIFDCLVKHGCADLSSLIDPNRYSSDAIASGGFGDVLQAWTTCETLVAVKCLRLHIIREVGDKGMKRMARELHHWSKARHENIQELLGIVMHQDRLGMVSLWMHNGNLQQYIEKNPNVDRYPLCLQVATGVAYMHGIGMVHGDLKAVNILVSTDGIAKISDFDFSVLSEGTLCFSKTTRTGGGTVRWMAPELNLHQGENDSNNPPVMRNKQTDVYALGMTMLETITGEVPYPHIIYDTGIIFALIRKQLPKRPQELSGPEERASHIWALLVTCWDHDPSARPDASSVVESLLSLIA